MSAQLSREIDATPAEQVESVRRMLLAAGEAALAKSDPACLLYGALTRSLSDPEPDPHPMLVGAALRAAQLRSDVVYPVIVELLHADGPEQAGLPAALGRELAIAVLTACLLIVEGRSWAESADTVPDGWTDIS